MGRLLSSVTNAKAFDGVNFLCVTLTFDLLTFNRWRMVVSATWKYDDPRLNMSHEGAAREWHVQPRVVIFPCRTNYRVSYVLSSDQLQESWIICKLKSFSPMYLHDLNTQDRRVIFGVSKTLCNFGHKKFFYRRINKLIIDISQTFCNLLIVPRCRQN